jgi:transcriptional regulator with XRE-family HTH domain
MKRKPDKRLVDELPDVDMPAAGYGQRELAVIEKLFRADLPDGELINLYFLVHDWAMDSPSVFEARFKQIEDVLLGRMSGEKPDEGEDRDLPSFDPEDFREATEAVCSGTLANWQVLELYAIAQANQVDEEIGHRWQAVLDLCRTQTLRRIKTTRAAATRRPGDETAPSAGRTPAEIEFRHAANENYGERIQSCRGKIRMYESSVADALCLTENDIMRAEEGSPPIDPRMILAPLLLAADYYTSDDGIDHCTSKTYVAHFYEAARRMTPKVREVWLLYHSDGLAVAEIAEWQNLSTTMIAKRIREAEMAVERFGPQPPKASRRKRRGRDA